MSRCIYSQLLVWALTLETFDSGATADAVKKAFELLLTEKKVKSIFVNICKSPNVLNSRPPPDY